jgi:hypothetical protein
MPFDTRVNDRFSEEIRRASDLPSHENSTERPPWLRSYAMDSSNDGTDLCLVCGHLDFQFLFNASLRGAVAEERTPRSTVLETGIRLGSVAELHDRSYCKLCSLVSGMLQTLRPDGTIPLEKNGQQIMCYLNNLVRNPTGLRLDGSKGRDTYRPFAFQLLITTQPPLVEECVEEPHQGLPPPPLIQRLSEGNLENSCYGRELPTSSIDFNLLSNWTQTCARKTAEESQMDGNISKPKQSSLSLRLIDVICQSLVVPIEAVEYIALSYMWGKVTPFTLIQANLLDLQKNGALSTNDPTIPQTIRDAMNVCRRLGERYLWVDSVCIMQDTKDKHGEIGQMDKIYQQAKMTIVAAYGTDADTGLPGVRPKSRLSSQHVVNVQGMKISNVLPGLGNAVDAAPWNTRAWTYQERLLSNRKLYFCKEQVFLECDHGQYREDMLIDPHSNTQPGGVTYGVDPKYGTAHKIVYRTKLNLHVYEEIVFEYTSRNLSYEEDILNAFQGVSNILSRDLFNSSPFVFGMPLCLLDMALLWYPTGPLHRRRRAGPNANHFPSWSWAGWVGRFDFGWYGNESEKTASRVEWLSADGSDIPFEPEFTGMPEYSWPHWGLWERHVGDGQFICYTRKDGDAERWFCHPIPDPVEGQPAPVDFQTGQLHLRAKIAKLTVTAKHSRRWCQSPKCDEGLHDKCELSIFDSDGIRAGVVTLDGNTFLKFIPGLHEFISLSQATLSHADSDPAWDEETESYAGKPGGPPVSSRPLLDVEDEPFDQGRYDPNICWCLYNVMMIEWQDGVAYRVGIGQMHIHAFDRASPQSHKILLG